MSYKNLSKIGLKRVSKFAVIFCNLFVMFIVFGVVCVIMYSIVMFVNVLKNF